MGTANQQENSKKERYAHLKPWQFKPGQSGNWSGKPKGTVSMKKRAAHYLMSLDVKGAKEFLRGLDKRFVWEMAEGKPDQKNEHTGDLILHISEEVAEKNHVNVPTQSPKSDS